MSNPQIAEYCVIERSTWISASPETVWSFWTEPERLCEWFGVEAEVVAECGGIVRIVMAEGPVMRGEFVELDPFRRLVFTFGWEANAADSQLSPGSTKVEITLTADAGGTVLVLRHLDMPASHAGEHEKGWAHFVDGRLAAALAESETTIPAAGDLGAGDLGAGG